MEPLMGVGLVMALLLGTAWIAVRRKNGLPLLRGRVRARMADRRLTIVERLPLTPSHSLHLVQLDGRPYLVATHAQGVTFQSAAIEQAPFAGILASASLQTPAGPASEGGRR